MPIPVQRPECKTAACSVSAGKAPRGRGPDHRLRSLRPFVVEMASLRGYRLGKKNGPTGSSRRAELANPVSQLVRANRPREPLIRRSAKEGNGAASCYHATAQHAKK